MILFKQAVPSRWFEIPIERVTGIEHPRFYLGKGYGGKLLVVNFQNEEEADDAIGWAVQNPEKWADEIRAVSD